MSDLPVIIEVALNGVTTKAGNRAAPEAAEELVADALDCLAAGASIVHLHQPSGARGRPASERYAAAMGPVMRARSDAILYPTVGGGETIAARYDHHIALADAGLIRMGVVDPGSVNLAATAADGTPPDSGFVYVNSPADIHYMLAVCGSYRVGPNFAIYEPGFLRVVVAYHAAGCLPSGSLTKLYFSEGGYFGGGQALFSAPPIPEALDLYLAMLGDTRLPWAVTVLGGSILDSPVALMALQRGGHLRVGLEDFASGPANVEQVRRAVALCAEVGRPVATCAVAASILGLPERQ